MSRKNKGLFAALVLGLALIAGGIVAPRVYSQRTADNLERVLADNASGKIHIVSVIARHSDGIIFYRWDSHNLRTNAGGDWQANQMGGTTAAACTYLALSNDAGAPAATDTAVAGEIATSGLARANGTFAHTTGTTTYTISKVFTATGAVTAQKAGMLNASTSGTLCLEDTFAQVILANNDTLTLWS